MAPRRAPKQTPGSGMSRQPGHDAQHPSHRRIRTVRPGQARGRDDGHDGIDTDNLETGSFPAIRPDQNPQTGTKKGLSRAGLSEIFSGVLIVLLCAGLGFGFVVQQRSVQSNYSSLSENELVRLLDETNRQITQLESQRTTLSRQLTSIQESADKQRQIQRVAKKNEEASGILSGRLPAQGKGVRVVITGKKHINAATLFNLIEELRNAGAEVIQFNSVRVVTSTYVVDIPSGVSCDGTALKQPYTFLAIGDPEALANAISIAGGVGSTLRVQYDAKVSVQKKDKIVISATAPVHAYSYATPVREDQ